MVFWRLWKSERAIIVIIGHFQVKFCCWMNRNSILHDSRDMFHHWYSTQNKGNIVLFSSRFQWSDCHKIWHATIVMFWHIKFLSDIMVKNLIKAKLFHSTWIVIWKCLMWQALDTLLGIYLKLLIFILGESSLIAPYLLTLSTHKMNE